MQSSHAPYFTICFDIKWETTEHRLYCNNWIFAIRKSLLQLCPLRNNTLFRFSFIESILYNLRGLKLQRDRCDMHRPDPSPRESIVCHCSVNSIGWFTPTWSANHFVRHILKTQTNLRAVSFVFLFYLFIFLLLLLFLLQLFC